MLDHGTFFIFPVNNEEQIGPTILADDVFLLNYRMNARLTFEVGELEQSD